MSGGPLQAVPLVDSPDHDVTASERNPYLGKYTFEDYLDSHRTAASRRRLVLRVVICIVALLLLIQTSWIERGLGILALAYAFFISGLIFRWIVGLQWKAYPPAKKASADMRFNSEGIHNEDDDGNPSTLKWDRFIRWAEGSRVILLFTGPHQWLMVPKRLMNDKQLASLRTLLNEQLT